MEGLQGVDPYSTMSTNGYDEALKLKVEVENVN